MIIVTDDIDGNVIPRAGLQVCDEDGRKKNQDSSAHIWLLLNSALEANQSLTLRMKLPKHRRYHSYRVISARLRDLQIVA